MKKYLFLILALSSQLFGQTVLPQAVSETLNMAPRNQRGDAQKYLLRCETIFMDDIGTPTRFKRVQTYYTQLCLANTPDSGLIYEITIDKIERGSTEPLPNPNLKSFSVVDTLAGYHFSSKFRSVIPVSGECYDHAIPLTKNQSYVEAYEFMDDFLPIKLLEQLRYSAGRRLSQIGDSVTIPLPKPICYSIKKVINESRLDQAPIRLQLKGITSYKGIPCALVSLSSSPSPLKVEIYSTDTSSYTANGTSLFSGEYLVSQRNGMIVSATLVEESASMLDHTDKSRRLSRSRKTYDLKMLN